MVQLCWRLSFPRGMMAGDVAAPLPNSPPPRPRMDSSPPYLAGVGRGITRADIDAWSLEIRQARTRVARHHHDGASAGTAAPASPAFESELELAYEELSVAEAELRTQNEDIAAAQLQL